MNLHLCSLMALDVIISQRAMVTLLPPLFGHLLWFGHEVALYANHFLSSGLPRADLKKINI